MKNLDKNKKSLPTLVITIVLIVFCILWTVPTLGILVTSFRTADAASATGWWTALSDWKHFTLDNYNQVLFGQRFSVGNATGTSTVRGATMLSAFLSSITVTLPSVIIPILIAAAAAYGFAWLSFKGRNVMFSTIIALLVVPLQISLIPILRDYNKIGLNGSYLGIWLAHTGFGLPLATYMMYN
ncbi:MAG: carbohydrate ABC transporter permease, partial [Treponema sp.]|nr:carbohydrate ABC transporter permease [Treponema sp.]